MTSPSDRDLAQQWLAERIAERRGHGGIWHGDLLDAAGILDTPGVIVHAHRGVAVGGYIAVPEDGDPYTHRQLVICLPVEQLSTQRTGEAAHQHDEES
jgi:hypothetical protein